MANAPPAGFERATLEIEGGGPPIECLFNPTEYSISKTNGQRLLLFRLLL